jgi:hypothetical protein
MNKNKSETNKDKSEKKESRKDNSRSTGLASRYLKSFDRYFRTRRNPSLFAEESEALQLALIYREELKVIKDAIKLKQDIPHSLTPDYLADTVTPFLRGIAELQAIIDEINGKERSIVRIKRLAQWSPINVNLQGGAEALEAIQDAVVPWRIKHKKEIANLQEQEKRAEIEVRKAEILEKKSLAAKSKAEAKKLAAEAARQREEAEALKLENEKQRLELHRAKIQLALDILSMVAPNLTESDKIAYVVKLLPPIDVLGSSELEVTTNKKQLA